MAVLELAGSYLFVRYLYDNNGSPYFQIRIPEDLQERFSNRKKISISLKSENGAPVVQVQRYAASYKTLFKAMRADPSLTDQDTKVASIALLQSYGLK